MINGPGKKPYTRPGLVVYGDIGQITTAAGMVSMMGDGGTKGNSKSS